jgi:LacI family transcriptional regulator
MSQKENRTQSPWHSVVTIFDIAREAEVSTTSVSLVLNNPDTKRVGAEKRQKILKIAAKQGYSPNAMARGLARRSAGVIGLIVPMRDPIFINHFLAEVLAGIQSCLIERGYHLLVFSESAKTGKISRMQVLQSRLVDGILFINTRLSTLADMEATIAELQSAHIAFVMINSYYGHEPVNYVGVDDEQIAYMAGEYLAARGHKRIAMLRGAQSSPSSLPLRNGLQNALKKHNLTLDPGLLAFGEYDENRVAGAATRWLKLKRQPTAIFCADDQMVPSLYEAVKSLGRTIPSDIAIIGRGGLDFTSLLHPKLTTIRVPAVDMGHRAADLLLNSLNAREARTEKVLLPCTILERESV